MDQNQDRLERNFILIPIEIFNDKRLTPCDKLIYGRINKFAEFYEAAATTGELLGISERQVKRSKQVLEQLGYIECIAETSKGKRYRTNDEAIRRDILARQKSEGCQIGTGGVTNWPKGVTNWPTESKKSLNGKESSSKDKSLEDASVTEDGPINEEQPKRYGNAEVNDALDLWEHETGFNHHSTKSERYAIAGLIKQHGYEPTKALIRRVGIATRSRDRFAPQIAKPSQLRGKYSKLEALVQWERRQDYRDPDQPNLRKLYETPEEYQRPEPEDTTTKEQRHANVEAIREQYRGTKYETIFCRRKAGDK